MVESIVENLRTAQRHVDTILRGLEAQGLVHLVMECPEPEPKGYGGVDGWFTRLLTVFSQSIYIYRVVGILLDRGHAVLRTVREDVVVSVDYTGSEDSMEEAEFQMMKAEAETAAELAPTTSWTILDGPLIDPPRSPRSPHLAEKYSSYHEERARILSGHSNIVGYVKTPRGEQLVSPSPGLRDPEIATMILTRLVSENNACAAWIGPFEPKTRLHHVYEDNGLPISVAYIQTKWWPTARKIEAKRTRIVDAVRAVLKATPPGLPHPQPVLVAHTEAGRLSKSTETLKTIIASRIASRTGLHNTMWLL